MKKLNFLIFLLFVCACDNSDTEVVDCNCFTEPKTVQFDGRFIIDTGDPYDNFFNPNFKLYFESDPQQNTLINGAEWAYSFKLTLSENQDIKYSIWFSHDGWDEDEYWRIDSLYSEGTFIDKEQLALIGSGSELQFDIVIPYP